MTLSPEDSEKAKSLEKQVNDAIAARDAFKKSITDKYTMTDGCDSTTASCVASGITNTGVAGVAAYYIGNKIYYSHPRYFKPGFEEGWQYTEDFKLVVPTPIVHSSNCTFGYNTIP